ncbi:MAG: bifunctional 4-hydroxy-3-methylbut-2-enyl diphosphate reductase/30S ribosomal protein S1 [Firmicutes bacterium]|nr:bifunctional 4-hydroxy-3-methylbut-2-enyl diphosphate reductase/30S ribosomal protein S1 [Bacillota bacterium]
MASQAGFCGGVKKAVDLALSSVRHGPLYALGPLAHNESLLSRLTEAGVIFVDELAEVPMGATVIIRSHGVRPEILATAAKRELTVINATCTFVQKLQDTVAQLVQTRQQVVIVGDREHPEIQGVLGWGLDQPMVVRTPADVEKLSGLDSTRPVAVVAQTTQQVRILDEIVEKLKEFVPVVQIYNTICKATALRQEAASTLAKEADVMVVVGSITSSNTRKLAAICRSVGTLTIEVTDADDLNTAQLQGLRTVGVTAGASTPDWLIKEVIAKMEEEKNVDVEVEEEVQEEAKEEEIVEVQEEQSAVEEVPMDQAVRDFSVGDVVNGTVVQVSDDEALIDIGYKSEGVLPRQEVILSGDQTVATVLQAGAEIEVVIKDMDDEEGTIILSRKDIERKQKWEELETAFNDGTILTGTVKETVQAGMVVNLGGGYEGFMPGSLVDIRFIPDFSEFLHQEVSFKIIEMRKEKEKLILSRKQVLEEEQGAKKEEILNALKPGEIIHGTVKRLTNFGAFVDVGGIDGLVHISEISWHRIETPGEVLSVGDEIDVKVTEVIPERERIGLSLRQAQPDPWTQIDKQYKVGDIVEGKVTRTVDFGAFVELIPGVEGLVHISQLANHHVKQSSDVVQQGQMVKVKILDINTEGKRVSLSMREAAPKPKRESQPQVQQPQDTGTGLTLGDVFGDLFKDQDK